MSDLELRKLERAAALGDPEADVLLQHARCRGGQCCAHALGPVLPAVPQEAADVVCLTESVEHAYYSTGPSIDHQAHVVLRLGGNGNGVHQAYRWLLELFPRESAVSPPPPVLGRFIGPAQDR